MSLTSTTWGMHASSDVSCLMSRVRLKLTFLFFGGGQSRGKLLVLYMVSSLSAMDTVVEQHLVLVDHSEV